MNDINSLPAFAKSSVKTAKKTSQKKAVSFGRLPNQSELTKLMHDVMEGTEKQANKELPKSKTLSYFMSAHDSEVQNQITNGIFTTTLAPLMIWLNPFSDKPEKDKAYSALRQPLSAIIAMTGGLAATLGVDKLLEKTANEGFIESQDLRMNPSDKYLKTSFEKALKEAKSSGKEAEFFDKYKPSFIKSDATKAEIKKAHLEEYAKKVRAVREEAFTKLMVEKPETFSVEGNKIVQNLAKNKVTVIGDIPGMSQEGLKKFLSKYNVNNISSLKGKSANEINDFVKATIKDTSKNFSNLKKIVQPI